MQQNVPFPPTKKPKREHEVEGGSKLTSFVHCSRSSSVKHMLPALGISWTLYAFLV